jgi:hypothetical protein
MKLTTQFHIVLRLRMHGVIPPLPQYIFITWCSVKHKKNFTFTSTITQSRDSSVGIALDYRLDNWGSRVLFPAGAGNFSLNHCVQNGSGAHPASYPMGTRGCFPGVKAAEV